MPVPTAHITAKKEDKVNTMTASWGGLGFIWRKPVAYIFIRPQRYTYEFVEKTDKLTLSFFGGEMREGLTLCGRTSGREVNKAEKAGLKNIKGHRVVGGMRASIYNAMPYEGVEALVAFMKDFAKNNPK